MKKIARDFNKDTNTFFYIAEDRKIGQIYIQARKVNDELIDFREQDEEPSDILKEAMEVELLLTTPFSKFDRHGDFWIFGGNVEQNQVNILAGE